jgi:alkylation response protein AidB-like acyl-CoA dehydrogenase
MDFELSSRALDYQKRVRAFVRDHVLPLEAARSRDAARHAGAWREWTLSPASEALKERARAEGLWNLFLPDAEHGAGLSSVEYAPVAEEMGWSVLAPEIFNCNAPDTGNMELLSQYGTPEQRQRWLTPLLEGRMRSAFAMTEPDVAGSDATGLRATAQIAGDDYILNGRKWWVTGLGHPHCALAIFVGVTEPGADRHRRHSLLLVPLDTPGVTIKRMLPVFGDYDEPYGHGELSFEEARVPRTNLLGGAGRGFELAQARLGRGRIHHCMRCVGAAERALSLLVERAASRTAFGQRLLELGGNRERIADLRVAIDQARLLCLHAAWRLDAVGALASLADVAAIKLVAPEVLQRVVDEAIQVFGAAGLASDLPLAALFAQARALRIADGPDAVHRALIAKLELRRHGVQ